mmetsp:Transcript_2083/g.4509  ORF Transcript_2083/g.4509 Transcript_2083/m.4509 type:complete len:575 (+) Transcript_2083:1678-3402(+)
MKTTAVETNRLADDHGRLIYSIAFILKTMDPRKNKRPSRSMGWCFYFLEESHVSYRPNCCCRCCCCYCCVCDRRCSVVPLLVSFVAIKSSRRPATQTVDMPGEDLVGQIVPPRGFAQNKGEEARGKTFVGAAFAPGGGAAAATVDTAVETRLEAVQPVLPFVEDLHNGGVSRPSRQQAGLSPGGAPGIASLPFQKDFHRRRMAPLAGFLQGGRRIHCRVLPVFGPGTAGVHQEADDARVSVGARVPQGRIDLVVVDKAGHQTAGTSRAQEADHRFVIVRAGVDQGVHCLLVVSEDVGAPAVLVKIAVAIGRTVGVVVVAVVVSLCGRIREETPAVRRRRVRAARQGGARGDRRCHCRRCDRRASGFAAANPGFQEQPDHFEVPPPGHSDQRREALVPAGVRIGPVLQQEQRQFSVSGLAGPRQRRHPRVSSHIVGSLQEPLFRVRGEKNHYHCSSAPPRCCYRRQRASFVLYIQRLFLGLQEAANHLGVDRVRSDESGQDVSFACRRIRADAIVVASGVVPSIPEVDVDFQAERSWVLPAVPFLAFLRAAAAASAIVERAVAHAFLVFPRHGIG